MADAYTATVVGAIGLAFSILALLLIVIIIGWLIVARGAPKNQIGDIESQARLSPDSRIVPVEGPEASSEGKKKFVDRWKTPHSYGPTSQVLRKLSDNLKEITPAENVLNGKHGGKSTFENLDTPTIYKRNIEKQEQVRIINIGQPDNDDNLDDQVDIVQEHHLHSSETLKLSEMQTEVQRSFTKTRGYYGPYAQENDSSDKN